MERERRRGMERVRERDGEVEGEVVTLLQMIGLSILR